MERPTKAITAKPSVVYLRRRSKPGEPVFTETRLPDGTIVRHMDEDLHERALSNASRRYQEKLSEG